jgi:UDP-3-O-acyl N-acetylglucosamine deacetylase
MFQQSLSRPVRRRGVGIHSGQVCDVWLRPAPPGSGRVFVRNGRRLPAHIGQVTCSQYRSRLGHGEGSVSTVEHLLAALMAMGVDNAEIGVEGPEIPVLDGSARVWVEAIEEAGLSVQTMAAQPISPPSPIRVEAGESWIRIQEALKPSIHVSIDFGHPMIGQAELQLQLSPKTFREQLAGARTFGFVDSLPDLKAGGFAKGAELGNCLAFTYDGLHPSQTLRWPDEALRHKALDLVGDIALMNAPLRAKVEAHRPSHALTHRALRKWQEKLPA